MRLRIVDLMGRELHRVMCVAVILESDPGTLIGAVDLQGGRRGGAMSITLV